MDTKQFMGHKLLAVGGTKAESGSKPLAWLLSKVERLCSSAVLKKVEGGASEASHR